MAHMFQNFIVDNSDVMESEPAKGFTHTSPHQQAPVIWRLETPEP